MANQLSSFRTRLARLEEAREEIAATIDRINATEVPALSLSGLTDANSLMEALKANNIAGAAALINASAFVRKADPVLAAQPVIDAEVIPPNLPTLRSPN